MPNLGGEVGFAPEYAGNPLVNAMAVGLVATDRIFRARAEGVGNPVFYVGAKTGRDGIHGATMASATFDEGAAERRPTVQVGDPFTEKLLLEACLEAMATGAIVGIQDMGAAGLACACSEMPARAGTGMEVDLDRVPQRESGMTPYEIMLSESQERMLLVCARGREAEIRGVFAKWELDAVEIGRVTGDGILRARMHGEIVAEVPVKALADEAPVYEKPTARPDWQDALEAFDPLSLPAAEPEGALLALAGSPAIASKAWVYRQYDTRSAQHRGHARLRRGGPAHQGHAARRWRSPPTAMPARSISIPRAGRRDGGGGGRPEPRRVRCAGPWASPTASTSARRSGPRSSGSSRRRWEASPRPAGRSRSRW